MTSSHNKQALGMAEDRASPLLISATASRGPRRASPSPSLAGIGSRDAVAAGHSGNVGHVALPLSVAGGASGGEEGAER